MKFMDVVFDVRFGDSCEDSCQLGVIIQVVDDHSQSLKYLQRMNYMAP